MAFPNSLDTFLVDTIVNGDIIYAEHARELATAIKNIEIKLGFPDAGNQTYLQRIQEINDALGQIDNSNFLDKNFLNTNNEVIYDSIVTLFNGDIFIKNLYNNLLDGTLRDTNQVIPVASATQNGLLSQALYTKLVDLQGTAFKGTYSTLAALQAAYPTADDGSFAYVSVVGTPAQEYIWDTPDQVWVLGSDVGADTPAEVKSKYESNADTNAFTDADVTSLRTTLPTAVSGKQPSIPTGSTTTVLAPPSTANGNPQTIPVGGANGLLELNASGQIPPEAYNIADIITIDATDQFLTLT